MTETSSSNISWMKVHHHEHTVACIDGDKVRSLRVKLPKLNEKDIAQALPHMLAKELITPIEHIHITHGPPSANGEVIAWCISRSHYNSLIPELKKANITLAVPDYMTLPYYPGSWTITAFNEYVSIRTGEFTGYSQRHELALLTLEQEILSSPPNNIHIISSSHESLNHIRAWAKTHGIDFTTESCDIPFMEQLPKKITLLQKKDRPKSNFRQYASAICALGISLALFVIVIISSQFIENRIYQSANNLIEQKILSYKYTHLPPSLRHLSLAQTQQRITAMLAHRHSTFNRLIINLDKVISRHPSIQLQSLQFTKTTLQATMVLPKKANVVDILTVLPTHSLLKKKIVTDAKNLTLTITIGASS